MKSGKKAKEKVERAKKKSAPQRGRGDRFATAAPRVAVELTGTARYINRELSLLTFFRRVLSMAADRSLPALERLRFLTIGSMILDEFFEIRVAGLMARERLGVERPEPDRRSVADVLREIKERVDVILSEQYQLLNEGVLPALAAEGIHILRRNEWSDELQLWTRQFFEEQIAPVLTPIGLDPAHPFPQIINKNLNILIILDGRDIFGRRCERAVLNVPRCLPRVISVPHQHRSASERGEYLLLSSIIHAHVDLVFPGIAVKDCHQFRVTRNADLSVEEEADDLLDALQGELVGRRYGNAVRLEVAANCPEEHVQFLLEHFGLQHRELYQVNGPVNLSRLAGVIDLIDRPELKFQAFTPGLGVPAGTDLFELLQQQPLLLHHPFESFMPVVELVRQAARDPDVLAIKQTLYRTGRDSPITEALLEAARAKKEVTVVIELQARFDEEANIHLAKRFQDAGAHVVYGGIVGYKTHSKLLLIVRREGGKLRRYLHMGTGNYHAGTARNYTDFGLLSSDPVLGQDLHEIFLQLTSPGHTRGLQRLLQAPLHLLPKLTEAVQGEIEEARAGRPAKIIIKVNSLSDPEMIEHLYEASAAGVEVELIVRGICCLRPGVPGLSERIRVRSIVGRFLEHSRIYYFYSGGEERLFLSSADWMQRNLRRRVETAFPVTEAALKQRIIREGLNYYLEDNSGAWFLCSDGSYEASEGGDELLSAQQRLLGELAQRE